MADQQRDARPYGQVLDAYLEHGGVLQPVAAGIPLPAGERCFGIGSGKLVRQEAGAWRPVDRGLIHVTDRRLVIEGAEGRTEIPLATVRSVADTSLLVEVRTDDGTWGLVLPYPDYWRVLLDQVLRARGRTPA